MAKGGYRAGAGRPKGSKNLPKLNAVPPVANHAVVRAPTRKSASGRTKMTPLDYMVSVMNDEEAMPERRDRMAIAAAVYVHAKPMPEKQAKEAAVNPEEASWEADLGGAALN